MNIIFFLDVENSITSHQFIYVIDQIRSFQSWRPTIQPRTQPKFRFLILIDSARIGLALKQNQKAKFALGSPTLLQPSLHDSTVHRGFSFLVFWRKIFFDATVTISKNVKIRWKKCEIVIFVDLKEKNWIKIEPADDELHLSKNYVMKHPTVRPVMYYYESGELFRIWILLGS